MSQSTLVRIDRPTDEFERQLDKLCEEFKQEMRKAKKLRRGRAELVAEVNPDGRVSDASYIKPLHIFPLKGDE